MESLQTVTAEREQQLMEDAETRLREVRRECKRRLEGQQRDAEVSTGHGPDSGRSAASVNADWTGSRGTLR